MSNGIINVVILGTEKIAEIVFYGISISDYNFNICQYIFVKKR